MSNKTIDVTYATKSKKQTNRGIEPKCWLSIDNVDWLYKYNPQVPDVTFGEVFVSELCKHFDIDCVDARFAEGTITINGKNNKQNTIQTKGCLIKSYLTPNVVESISLSTIDSVVNKINIKEYTPDNIYETVKKFSEGVYEIDEDVLQNLKNITLFDYLTVQADRHDENVEFLIYDDGGKKHIRLAPMFDNGRCFNFMLKPDELMLQDELFITGETPFWFMDECLTKDDNSFADCTYGLARELERNKELKNLFENMKQLDMRKFIDDFVLAHGVSVSKISEQQIVETWNHRIKKIIRAVQRYKQPQIKEKIEKFVAMKGRLNLAEDLKNTDFFVNYYYDMRHGGKHKLIEYIRQDIEFRKQLAAWKEFKIDVLKMPDDFPLLKSRCSSSEKRFYQNQIQFDRQSRKIEMKEYKRTELVPDYLTLDLVQGIKDIKSGKSKKTLESLNIEIEQAKKRRDKELEKWVMYGDCLMQKPTFESMKIDTTKKYDDDVVEEYIRCYEAGKGKNSAVYKDWLKNVGKVEFAKKFRREIGK